MCERSRSASSSEYIGKLCSVAPGVPKKLGWAPAATTRTSAVTVLPWAVVTERLSGSIETTAARSTSTVSSCRKIPRSGRAMSYAAICAVATW